MRFNVLNDFDFFENRPDYLLTGLVIGGLGAAAITAGASVYSAHKTNSTNKEIARETNDVNKTISQDNLDYQRENLDYQKALQQQIFDREDTSYQRTVNDMRSAGMSPLAMQGTNGAGEAVSTTPLNNGYQQQSYTQDYSGYSNGIGQGIQAFTSLMTLKNQLELAKEQVKSAKLDNALKADTLSSNVAATNANNQVSVDTLISRIDSQKHLTDSQKYNALMDALEYAYEVRTGNTHGTSVITRQFNELNSALDSKLKDNASNFVRNNLSDGAINFKLENLYKGALKKATVNQSKFLSNIASYLNDNKDQENTKEYNFFKKLVTPGSEWKDILKILGGY